MSTEGGIRGLQQEPGFFHGKTALVTGAGSGIGYEVALGLASAGSLVAIHYARNQTGITELKSRIEAGGGRAFVLQGDLSRSAEVTRVFEELDAATGGRLDLLVNNAGEWMDQTPVVDCPEAQWDRMLEVNAKSVFLCCQQAARRMIRQKSGAMVNIGSVAGHTGGGGGTVPYAAAKAAVHTLTRGLARELALHGIRVNAVSPGMVNTRMLEGRISPGAAARLQAMTPMGRMAEPREIASVVMMLLSPATSFMTGQVVDVNGGLLMR